MSRKTYRGRSQEEQRRFNRERREKLARVREAKIVSGTVETYDANGNLDMPDLSDILPEIEVQKFDIPKVSFKDKLLGMVQEEESTTKRKSSGAMARIEDFDTEKTESLVTGILPMTLSALAAVGAQRAFSDKYKRCAPTQQEISTILLPIFRIISRHIGIEGKASKDMIDAASSMLALITISTRMLMTAEDISNETRQPEQHTTSNSTNTISTNNRGNNPAESSRSIRHNNIQNETNGAPSGSRNATNGASDGGDDDTGGRSWEANAVADLLRRDTLGRREQGYAPKFLSSVS